MTNNNLNYEELRDAVELIHDTCAKYTCSTCPFGNDDGICLIANEPPCNWTYIDPTPVVRILK